MLVIMIGYIYLSRLYGKEAIKNEFPLRVGTDKHRWVISGTLPEGYLGGVAVIYLNKVDGKIEEHHHYK